MSHTSSKLFLCCLLQNSGCMHFSIVTLGSSGLKHNLRCRSCVGQAAFQVQKMHTQTHKVGPALLIVAVTTSASCLPHVCYAHADLTWLQYLSSILRHAIALALTGFVMAHCVTQGQRSPHCSCRHCLAYRQPQHQSQSQSTNTADVVTGGHKAAGRQGRQQHEGDGLKEDTEQQKQPGLSTTAAV